jgi:hypothetical protein
VFGGWGPAGKPRAHQKYIAAGLILSAVTGFLLLNKRQ